MTGVFVTAQPAAGLSPQFGPPPAPRWLGEPLRFDNRGRAARVSDDRHIVDEIRAVLFTEPGERVNRPDFGCALRTMVFLPNHEALVAATHTLVQAALHQWLSDRILVERVDVQNHDANLEVTVVYRRVNDGSAHRVTVGQSLGGPGQ